jgi:hypothetical protein
MELVFGRPDVFEAAGAHMALESAFVQVNIAPTILVGKDLTATTNQVS